MATGADRISGESKKAMNVMSTASVTLRDAISRSLPVANNQLLTVTIPGSVITWEDYYYDRNVNTMAPLSVRVNEARLVDGMLPLSKISLGKTGKSVARSYLGALDLLMPVEASVSGMVSGNTADAPADGRRKVIKQRYDDAMKYLTSTAEQAPNDPALPESKLTRYVKKQEAWAKQVETYSVEQERVRKSLATQFPRDEDTRARKEAFLEWIQEHSRDFKAAISARYMDWVVHGYKFNIEFNFGIVDITSGMKRVESSKEALRNLVVIAEDGYTEYNQVVLEPSDWATIIRDKVIEWDQNNALPTVTEIRAEIKRLTNLKQSCEALRKNAAAGQYGGVIPSNDSTKAADDNLQNAYSSAYTANQTKGAAVKNQSPPDPAYDNLTNAYNNWKGVNLQANREAVVAMTEDQKRLLDQDLSLRITQLDTEITSLQDQLKERRSNPQPVIDQTGAPVDASDMKKGDQFNKTRDGKPTGPPPSKWTRITAKVSRAQSESTSVKQESSSSFAAKVGWGGFHASAGAAQSSVSSRAMSSMSNLEVQVTMECLVVNIDRPWLHAELFTDADLDVGSRFRLSPGEDELMDMVESDTVPAPDFQQFSSYPTAMVVAANVELSFSGDTSDLQSSLDASSLEANARVGWGPFSLNASHKQSRTASKTRTETTAAGMKISLQAPQIIGWVQTLMPELPKNPTGKSRMEGLAVAATPPPAQAAPALAAAGGTPAQAAPAAAPAK